VIGWSANAAATLGRPVGKIPDWIVCLGAMRSVVDGLVVCPAGISAPWRHCLGCRHLTVAADDRGVERFCSTDPQPSDGLTEGSLTPASWAELFIELL